MPSARSLPPEAVDTSHQDVISPALLAAALGQKHRPSAEQSAITAAPPGPLLVIAGAGAGKTETMAARVVWLVANGYVDPQQVLGLTFTRKAAQQLRQRIARRLRRLAGIPRTGRLAASDPHGTRAALLADAQPKVATYDAYAGELLREYGLLLPVEPGARVLSATELFQVSLELVKKHRGVLRHDVSAPTAASHLIALYTEMNNHRVGISEVREESEAFAALFDELPRAPRQRKELNSSLAGWRDTQLARVDYLGLVELLHDELRRRHAVTFDAQMALAARLATESPHVGMRQRQRFRVVMLDEYQDTSHSQRVLLSSLFGNAQGHEHEEGEGTLPLTVTAVGDPMQSIYGWRGATSANLHAFVSDFPTPHGDAPVRYLTTSYRNPKRVLELANSVADGVLGTGSERVVPPLTPFDDTPGTTQLAWYRTEDEERAHVADLMAERYRQAQEEGTPFTGAVLVRANSASAPMAEELRLRGVPCEIVNLSGLLSIPEVADVVALLTMLVRPADNRAALRILAGPHVGLSAADIKNLYRRSRNLAGRMVDPSVPKPPASQENPEAHLRAVAAECVPAASERVVGLTDALADLGEGADMSAEGLKRLRRLAAELRYLRRHSLAKSLTDLVADVERVTGLRTEVLARRDPGQDGAAGTAHLDRFAEEVARYAAVPGATLGGLLDYLALAQTQERGLEPAVIPIRADRVQILTVHKAKGLEWDTVAVLHCDKKTWDAKAKTYLTQVAELPAAIRGDAGEEGGVPVLDTSEVENRKDLEGECKQFLQEVRCHEAEENSRLFYVAITRAEKCLSVSGAAYNATRKNPTSPLPDFARLKDKAPDAVAQWWEEAPKTRALPGQSKDDAGNAAVTSGERAEAPPHGSENYPAEKSDPALFPALIVPPGVAEGAALVESVLRGERIIPLSDGEVAGTWETDATALVEEQAALEQPVVNVELSSELTVTDVVSLRRDPQQFARRQRRPVPFKPNRFAKRGTAFHNWLEERFASGGAVQALFSEEDAYDAGSGEAYGTAAGVASATASRAMAQELRRLQEAFESSEWADRIPVFVERPFELAIGRHVLRGRMDAVFHDASARQWTIVDWKTGAPPSTAERRAADLQLAVYRLAFQEWLMASGRDGDEVSASFHYVGVNKTLRPTDLPDRRRLLKILDDAGSVGNSAP